MKKRFAIILLAIFPFSAFSNDHLTSATSEAKADGGIRVRIENISEKSIEDTIYLGFDYLPRVSVIVNGKEPKHSIMEVLTNFKQFAMDPPVSVLHPKSSVYYSIKGIDMEDYLEYEFQTRSGPGEKFSLVIQTRFGPSTSTTQCELNYSSHKNVKSIRCQGDPAGEWQTVKSNPLFKGTKSVRVDHVPGLDLDIIP